KHPIQLVKYGLFLVVGFAALNIAATIPVIVDYLTRRGEEEAPMIYKILSSIQLSGQGFWYVYLAISLLTSLVWITWIMGSRRGGLTQELEDLPPNLLVDNTKFVEAGHAPWAQYAGATVTAEAGRGGLGGSPALFGDVEHTPWGEAGTPSHQLVRAGKIHEADGGVLFVDEIRQLTLPDQERLLTIIEKEEWSITGVNPMSSGAMVSTEPVPARWILILAGNVDSLKYLHTALRSRIEGYGFQVYFNSYMPDTLENRDKIAEFVAQEISKSTIPHGSREFVEEVYREARRRSPMPNTITLILRDLAGVIRQAGYQALDRVDRFIVEVDPRRLDAGLVRERIRQFAEYGEISDVDLERGRFKITLRDKGFEDELMEKIRRREIRDIYSFLPDVTSTLIEKEDLLAVLEKYGKTIEDQIADEMGRREREYKIIFREGFFVGRVNGLYVRTEKSGGVGVIVGKVSRSREHGKGQVIFSGSELLGPIARKAVQNVEIATSDWFGEEIRDYDVYLEYLQSYEPQEGDSASIDLATATISAFQKRPIDQRIAMTGSLDITGLVLPVGGIPVKLKAAYDAGLRGAIIPKKNVEMRDLDRVDPALRERIEIVDDLDKGRMTDDEKFYIFPVEELMQVLEVSMSPPPP
ncbi:MAG: S16 family serine protease, partial [Candidatus Bathyarchaeia archaeon]